MSDEQSCSYKVKIEGPGLSLERDVPKEIGDQVAVLLLTGKPTDQGFRDSVDRRADGKTGSGSGSSDGIMAMSIREFLDDREAKRVPDKITSIGAYLRDNRQQPNFTRDDLVHNFEAAAESVPKNLARDIKWTLKAGWIAQRPGQKDAYYVTQSGNNAIQQRFSSEVVQKTRGMVSGGKKEESRPQNNQ